MVEGRKHLKHSAAACRTSCALSPRCTAWVWCARAGGCDDGKASASLRTAHCFTFSQSTAASRSLCQRVRSWFEIIWVQLQLVTHVVGHVVNMCLPSHDFWLVTNPQLLLLETVGLTSFRLTVSERSILASYDGGAQALVPKVWPMGACALLDAPPWAPLQEGSRGPLFSSFSMGFMQGAPTSRSASG